MRALVRLTVAEDCAYDRNYNHKLRGRIYDAFHDTEWSAIHNANQPPGLCFSNPFPFDHEFSAGEEKNLIISTVHGADLLTEIVQDLCGNPQLDIGHMRFHVDEATFVEPDVGPPGTTGTIETDTGIVQPLRDDICEEYGISTDYDHRTYWTHDHPLDALVDALRSNLDFKHALYGETDTEPSDHAPLFDGYNLIKTFADDKNVSTDHVATLPMSKWRFDYEVRDETHRQHLNLALACGLGAKNSLGLGFINIT